MNTCNTSGVDDCQPGEAALVHNMGHSSILVSYEARFLALGVKFFFSLCARSFAFSEN